MELIDFDADNTEERQQKWVVLALLCTMQDSNDPQCLPENEESVENGRLSHERANVRSGSAAATLRVKYKKQQSVRRVTLCKRQS